MRIGHALIMMMFMHVKRSLVIVVTRDKGPPPAVCRHRYT